ncbi:response regulator transcription factor [Pseudoalteromonas lipolytica]|uniref:Response regulator transcription factor n=1 Tax=Pseudoalteromonas lipolytica TaxID=570156 RepID=A0ABU8T0U5_9GAMM
MKPINIVLLDDHAVVRQGLVSYFNDIPDITVVGVYSSSRELIRSIGTTSPDVLLVDYILGRDELDGVSLIRALRARFPACRVLVLSTEDDPASVSLILKVGAQGFIGKDEDLSMLPKAIRQVASNKTYINEETFYALPKANQNLDYFSLINNDTERLLSALSIREHEVIRCFLDGMTITEIAGKFNRSIKTISTHKTNAFRKLGVKSNNALFKLIKNLKQ